MLTRSGYEVECAPDGEVALEALLKKNYDLLITDQNMPRVTGLELVRNLRSARMTLPVVMVAGVMPEEELAQNPALDVAATLSKPFEMSTLLDTVEHILHMAA
jgi:DNA-binding response OmpR family regulator